ncbi:hypothetical protein BRC99_05135 [Halobacteriales archaeon QS_7_69_60]|nr:MAG: hypothetical protein BRC99_05135 [Halobacteriales archaeon QS_7_69_60]
MPQPALVDAHVERAQRVTSELSSFPAPTIAAIDGHRPGGGWDPALNCDLLVAGERAVIRHTEPNLAVVPARGGIRTLVRPVGDETPASSFSSPNDSTHETLQTRPREERYRPEDLHNLFKRMRSG